MDYTQASYMQPYPSTSQAFETIRNKQHQPHHHAPRPPPRPPGPPIKVNLQSKCLDCQVKLKKKLQKMSGVNDVDIVSEQGGTVTVSGSIDSKVLMEMIRNNYKEAKLLCPFEKNEPSKYAVCQQMSCSDDECDESKDDDPGHNYPANNNPDNDDNNDAGSISEPKKDKKMKMCGIMRCFGKKSNPTPIRPPPPPPPKPEPRPPLMGIPTNGFFHGPLIRPTLRPGMPWMPPYGPPPPPPPPPYEYLGRPPLPTGFGYPFQRSPPRSNPMVHYTDYRDNYRYH